MQDNLDQIATLCSNIKLSVPKSYKWEWDSRFECALVVVPKKDANKVVQNLEKHFINKFDISTINKASTFIKSFVDSVLGLNAGQIFFHSDEKNDLIIFGAWWPWGNGENFSIRIGICSFNEAAFNKIDMKKTLSGWFNF